MNAAQAIEYIHSLERFGSRPGLERITRLCSLLGDPQDALKFVHVAGTNGKGSVAAALTAMLEEHGMRAGRYTSPFVLRFNERICIGEREIDDGELAGIVGEVKRAADKMEDTPTEFEFITAAAFAYYARRGCDAVVLETGLGGRLDATNVVKTPVISVITGIALDHTDVLGATEEQIAAEKGGIIKPGVPVVCGEVAPGAARVLREIAADRGAPCIFTDFSLLDGVSLSMDGCRFTFDDEEYATPLIGEYQPRNMATAITAAKALSCTADEIKRALARLRWRARFEVLSRDPVFVYDGAHNPQAARSAAATAGAVFPGEKTILVTATMRDKDYETCARIFAGFAREVYCAAPDHPRALAPEALAQVYRSLRVPAAACHSIEDAVKRALARAREERLKVIFAGTLYAYREVTQALEGALDNGGTV